MQTFSFKTLRSSFWFWFVTVLIINQFALLAIFYIMVLKPGSQILARVVGATAEMAIQQRPQQHRDAVRQALAKFDAISLDETDVRLEEVPPYYLGMRIIKATLEKTDANLQVGYTANPEPMLVVKSSALPGLSIRFAMGASAYAPHFLMLTTALMLVLSALGAFWLSTRLVQPLQHLSAAAERLGRERGFHRIDQLPGSSREVSQLTESLNQMQTMLDTSIQERENLLAGVAHDLRTPLSRMRIAIELEDEKNRAFTDGLLEDVVEMGAVMEQFIELSRLNLEVDEPWQIGDLNAIVQALSAKYQRARIDLSLLLAEGMPPIRHKPLALTRLLYNLIDNAYRHGNGRVTIETNSVGNQIVLKVSNPVSVEGEETGLMRAFREQGSGKTAGLGLSIVRRFAEVHDAVLSVRSENKTHCYILKFKCAPEVRMV